jgi:hypothetical protein
MTVSFLFLVRISEVARTGGISKPIGDVRQMPFYRLSDMTHLLSFGLISSSIPARLGRCLPMWF